MRNRVRIIGGRWRSRLVKFPALPQVRPSPDRARETLFNWLGQDVTGLTALDLFAGSGVLSFEALSRGAALVVSVDRSQEVCRALQLNSRALGASNHEIHCVDAIDFIQRETRRFDFIFVDPPFKEDWLGRLWPSLGKLLNPSGKLYVEAASALSAPPSWRIWRQDKAGRVHYHVLEQEKKRDETC